MYIYLAYNLLQNVPDGVVDKALEASPYNAIAYGLLVALLIVSNFMQWRYNKQLQDRQYEYIEKAIGLIQIVESKMEKFQQTQADISDIQKDIELIKEKNR